jgi:hypothetical protein
MLLDNWDTLATGFASYVREFLPHAPRGALTIRLPRGVGHVTGVFGNDGYAADGRVKTQVAVLRRRLQEAALDELGFGLSEDGHTWALLVGPGSSQRHTLGGESLPEALAASLDDAVWEAWLIACEARPPEPSPEGPDSVECLALAGRAMVCEAKEGVR